jgi:predicted nucleic acid-binding protein
MGLILDSSVVIAAERRGVSPVELVIQVERLTGDQHAALSSIGLSELVHGIYRANTPERKVLRRRYVDELRSGLKVYPFTEETAMIAGKIDGEQTARGMIIPIADLLIGATALSLGFSVLTSNARHFQLIPGLSVIAF